MTGVVRRLLARHRSGRPLLVSLDWTDIRGLQTLVAAASVKGRAVPLCWASCRKHTYDVRGRIGAGAFGGSDLRQMLGGRGVMTLDRAGFATHVCIEQEHHAARSRAAGGVAPPRR